VSRIILSQNYDSYMSHRNIDKLPTMVSKETVNCLKGFIGLKNEQEIDDWHTFCCNHPDKSVQSKLAGLLDIIK
jgi:hypothetical protein